MADPSVGSRSSTPGPVYEVPGELCSGPSLKFSRGPAHFSPEKGGNQKGPYISK